MSGRRGLPPAPEDLPRLYEQLTERLDGLEGMVRQLQAEGTGNALRPSWRDLQAMQQEIEALRKQIERP